MDRCVSERELSRHRCTEAMVWYHSAKSCRFLGIERWRCLRSDSYITCTRIVTYLHSSQLNLVGGTNSLGQLSTYHTSVFDGIFDFADVDGSGLLELQEFLSLVNFTKNVALTAGSDILDYVKHLFDHDSDGDGSVSFDEHHSASS